MARIRLGGAAAGGAAAVTGLAGGAEFWETLDIRHPFLRSFLPGWPGVPERDGHRGRERAACDTCTAGRTWPSGAGWPAAGRSSRARRQQGDQADGYVYFVSSDEELAGVSTMFGSVTRCGGLVWCFR